jgi:serine/threonine protein kinase
MGEVYKALDTRLDRTVALKVLPAEFAGDADRRARFAREAKAVAALSHPHICALYDVGRAVVPNPEFPAAEQRDRRAPSPEPRTPVEVSVDYLVMEYLEGETLSARLARAATRTRASGPPASPGSRPSGTPTPDAVRRSAPLPLDETLRIGTELAEALAAAHRAGIIHRDLKPGNVMLTPSGAKVLDFGLARLRAADAAPDASAAATHSMDPLTDAGTRLGTVPYMAPEQVEGKEADARSDIFALGAVLYELATGRRAFEGDTTASIAAAILDREPPPLTTLHPLAPPAFEHVVTTCLAKDPEARWQAASDIARELRWVADEQRTGRTPARGHPAEIVATVATARRRNSTCGDPATRRRGRWPTRRAPSGRSFPRTAPGWVSGQTIS